ncbi:DUF6516 family protein [Ferrimonas marina]|uniref:Uncharacterized protein n=1 Tax=Ferrimonas marina TaxID=299255 RepID=A0A1M5TU56_9GAMM|nr:DUF6516 family protein [Ferrimonas marina]SHH54312.1 hypothetical protein SAMN02745129_2280 [Ferrimonas marina]
MNGLDVLLYMDGNEVHREDGYWYKVNVHQVAPTKARPHGLRYNLTLHNRYGKRVFGIDNAHSIKVGKKYRSRVVYDHQHLTSLDKGTPYEFTDCVDLISYFFEMIDVVIDTLEKTR